MRDAAFSVGLSGVIGSVVGLTVLVVLDRPPALRVEPAAVLLAVASVAGGLVGGSPLVAGVGPVVTWFAVLETRQRTSRREERKRQAVLPVVVDDMIQQLRSGLGLRTVCAAPIEVAAGSGGMLASLVEALRSGRSLRASVEALQREAGRQGWPDVQLLATTLAALVDRGGPAIPALVGLRLTLTGSVEARNRARVQSGQAQASAALLAGAPALFALVVALADHDVGRFYVREPLGAICVSAALVLSFWGWRWMNRYVDRAVAWSSGPRSGLWG